MTNASMLQPGLSEPVHTAQQVFRRALAALSEPGQVQTVADVRGLDRLAPATYALCLCLLDSDTPVWLSPSLDSPVLRANLAFHCGCPIVATPEHAAFALIAGSEATDLPAFNAGTDRDPGISCTVLIQLDTLEGGKPTTWQGPGIPSTRAMRVPLRDAFWSLRAAYVFPKGLDFFLTADNMFVGLPRSTRVMRMMKEEI